LSDGPTTVSFVQHPRQSPFQPVLIMDYPDPAYARHEPIPTNCGLIPLHFFFLSLRNNDLRLASSFSPPLFLPRPATSQIVSHSRLPTRRNPKPPPPNCDTSFPGLVFDHFTSLCVKIIPPKSSEFFSVFYPTSRDNKNPAPPRLSHASLRDFRVVSSTPFFFYLSVVLPRDKPYPSLAPALPLQSVLSGPCDPEVFRPSNPVT